jgi:hypothetical protein
MKPNSTGIASQSTWNMSDGQPADMDAARRIRLDFELMVYP